MVLKRATQPLHNLAVHEQVRPRGGADTEVSRSVDVFVSLLVDLAVCYVDFDVIYYAVEADAPDLHEGPEGVEREGQAEEEEGPEGWHVLAGDALLLGEGVQDGLGSGGAEEERGDELELVEVVKVAMRSYASY